MKHIGAAWARVELDCPWAPHFPFTLQSAQKACETTADGGVCVCVCVREVGGMLVVALSQHTCHKRDCTGARLLKIAFMTSNGTICHCVLLSQIRVVVFSFKGSCCVSLCGNDIGNGDGVGLEKK